MDKLKQSLEKAIEELRDAPPVDQRRPPPAPNSIEAALVHAPTISPHYLPQPLAPAAPYAAGAERAPSFQQNSFAGTAGSPDAARQRPTDYAGEAAFPGPAPVWPPRYELPRPPYEEGGEYMPQPAPRNEAAPFRPPIEPRAALETAQPPRMPVLPPIPAASAPRADVPRRAFALRRPVADDHDDRGYARRNRDDDDGEPVHAGVFDRLPDGFWRWATIVISCVGGLASGWLGSQIAGNGDPAQRSGRAVIVGEPSRALQELPPPSSVAAFDGSAGLSGKGDRIVPIDETHCTVLELDRGTGLTLAKPCAAVETAEFITTLSKADLLAQP